MPHPTTSLLSSEGDGLGAAMRGGNMKRNSAALSSLFVASCAVASVAIMLLLLTFTTTTPSPSPSGLLQKHHSQGPHPHSQYPPKAATTRPPHLSKLLAPNAPESIQAFVDALPSEIEGMLDTTASPCEDFHRFACGKWEDTHPVPPYKTANSYTQAGDLWVLRSIHDICVEEAAGVSSSFFGSYSSVVGQFYHTCMDVDSIEKVGSKPLADWFQKVDAVHDADSLGSILGEMHKVGVAGMFKWKVEFDHLDPTRFILILTAGAYSLPRSYLYQDHGGGGTGFAGRQRSALTQFYSRVFEELGTPSPSSKFYADAENAVKFEGELAEHAHDPSTNAPIYWDIAMLSKNFQCISWSKFFESLGYVDVGEARIHLKNTAAFESLCNIISSAPLPHLHSYLKGRLAFSFAPFLSSRLHQFFADFRSLQRGADSHHKRGGMCTGWTVEALPMRVGKRFVERYLSEDMRTQAQAMTAQVHNAFRTMVQNSQWILPETRNTAVEKLDKMFFEIGWPEVWQLENVQTSDAFFDNLLSTREYDTSLQLSLLSSPVDRSRWRHSPASSSASYIGGAINGIFVGGGMLHWPFWSPVAPPPHNFGSLGAVIGHEIVHSVDSDSRHFDQNGVSRAWWDAQTEKNFQTKEGCVTSEYDRFEMWGIHVSGKRTLAENIADIGGLHAAYNALLAANPSATLTDKRLFWLSFAQNWCGTERRRVAWAELQGGHHSPDKFRVIGPLAQSKLFAEDFGCKAGSPMAPVNRCDLW